MSMIDTIADMLTRIRNAQKAKLLGIEMPSSKMKCAVLNVLLEEGYIKSYDVNKTSEITNLSVALKYLEDGTSVISEIHRVSKPGKRVYLPINKLKGYYNHTGIYILSTSKGVISDRLARILGVGGEVICKVF